MQVSIIKIGGNIIDNKTALTAFLKDFAAIGGHKILVHGGGKIATGIGEKLDIVPNYVNGRRITDAPTLDLVTMVYGGLINKNIVARLQSLGCDAIGLTGADGAVLPAVMRPVKEIDYGFVGDVHSDRIRHELIITFLKSGLVPVFAPLTYNEEGTLLNTNADTIAQEIAKALAPHTGAQLIYCFEKKGVLMDAADDESVISSISSEDFVALKEKEIVTAGMIPKLENAFTAINAGVQKVIIGHADQLADLISGHAGTTIK